MKDETGRIRAADNDGIAAATALLASGGIAAIPTETVYGLAADAANGEAVATIYAAKGRPRFNPLIVHVADVAMARRYARFEPLALSLAKRFWPGPLTLVLPRLSDAPVAALVTAGLPTIALRVPAHPVMQAVIRGLDRGVAAPSANASGHLSPTRAAHVAASLESVPLILDAGETRVGLESTIVAITNGQATLLRQGGIATEELEALTGPLALADEQEPIAAPGMMLRHYAPRLPLVSEVVTPSPDAWHIGFGAVAGDDSLSASGDLVEAASRLFDALHRAERSGRARIEVAPVPRHGLGAAINDRLTRAARGRSGPE